MVCRDADKTDSIVITVQANDFDSVFTKVGAIELKINSLTTTASAINTDTSGVSTDIGRLLAKLGSFGDTDAADTLFGELDAVKFSAAEGGENVALLRKGLAKEDTDALLKDIKGYVDDVENTLGANSDTAERTTIFGKLAGMESVLAAAGADATNAALYARDAKSQAISIAATIAGIRANLNEGNMDEAITKLNALGETMADLQGVMDKIPEGIATEGLVQSVKDTLDELNGLAEAKGYEGMVPAMAEEFKPLDPNDITEIRNSVSGLKSLMTEVRNLLDKEVNKPVVHGWLEESEE